MITTPRRTPRSTHQRVCSILSICPVLAPLTHVFTFCVAFSNKAWRNFLLVTIGGLAFYKFAPSPEGDTWFGRTLAYWAIPKEIWSKANGDHLIKAADLQDGQLILTDAKLPPVHRFRYPQ